MAVRKPTPQEIYERVLQAIAEGRWQTAQRLLEALYHISPNFQDTAQLRKFVIATIKAGQKATSTPPELKPAQPGSKAAAPKAEPIPAQPEPKPAPPKAEPIPAQPKPKAEAPIAKPIPIQLEPKAAPPKAEPIPAQPEPKVAAPKAKPIPAQPEPKATAPNAKLTPAQPEPKAVVPKAKPIPAQPEPKTAPPKAEPIPAQPEPKATAPNAELTPAQPEPKATAPKAEPLPAQPEPKATALKAELIPAQPEPKEALPKAVPIPALPEPKATTHKAELIPTQPEPKATAPNAELILPQPEPKSAPPPKPEVTFYKESTLIPELSASRSAQPSEKSVTETHPQPSQEAKQAISYESLSQENETALPFDELELTSTKPSFHISRMMWIALIILFLLSIIGLIVLAEKFTPSKQLTMVEKMQTMSPPTATYTNSPTAALSPTLPTATPTFTPTLIPTASTIPFTDTPLPTPTLGIGSTILSPLDNMTMVYVPAGEFLIGPAKKKVFLDAFWMDSTEVTNAKYIKCIEDDTCSPPSRGRYKIADLADHPVIWVNWFQAQGYCRWAGKRLPTEAEWEKAARGTDGRTYPWGEKPPKNTLANVCDQSCPSNWSQKATEEGLTTTVQVAKFPLGISPYGAYDMAGNVWEWVADWYDDNIYYTPTDANPLGPKIGNKRVIRGGSWTDLEAYIRTYNRDDMTPQYTLYNIGFRCAMTP